MEMPDEVLDTIALHLWSPLRFLEDEISYDTISKHLDMEKLQLYSFFPWCYNEAVFQGEVS